MGEEIVPRLDLWIGIGIMVVIGLLWLRRHGDQRGWWIVMVIAGCPGVSDAVTIVSTSTEDTWLSREFLTPGCEWIDTWVRSTTVVVEDDGADYREDMAEAAQRWSGARWPRHNPEYHGFPNPCYFYRDGTLATVTPEWCAAPVYEAWLRTPGHRGFGGGFSFTTTTIAYFTQLHDECPPGQCDGHGGDTTVPESGTLGLGVLGIVLAVVSRGFQPVQLGLPLLFPRLSNARRSPQPPGAPGGHDARDRLFVGGVGGVVCLWAHEREVTMGSTIGRKPKDDEVVWCEHGGGNLKPERVWESRLPDGKKVRYGIIPAHTHGYPGEACEWQGLAKQLP